MFSYVQNSPDTYLFNGRHIPIDPSNSDYRRLLRELDAGEAITNSFKAPVLAPGALTRSAVLELHQIDLRSIGPLRSGDTVAVAALEAEAQVIRNQFNMPP